MSKVNALYHIVFCTKNREMTIANDHREDVYRFIWKIIQNHNSKLIRISGIANHIHLLLDLNPTVALSSLLRTIKSESSGWMKTDKRFPKFKGWAHEYYAATVSYENRDCIIEYIKSQQQHHSVESFEVELERLIKSVGLSSYEGEMC